MSGTPETTREPSSDPSAVAGVRARTLGSLNADDLGDAVTFTDGGATYTGALDQVQHSQGFRGQPRTMVCIEAGKWRHIGTHPPDTPCDVAAAFQPKEDETGE